VLWGNISQAIGPRSSSAPSSSGRSRPASGPSTSPRRSGSPPCRPAVRPEGHRVRRLGREGPLPARPPPGGAASPSPECVVSKGPALGRSIYCPRCRRSVQHRDLRAGALREAWGRGGFGCRCTGAVLADPWSPWSLDRRVPGDPRRRRVVGERRPR
jgi:hypothetical protein